MSEAVVTCRICRTDADEPRRWRWLCEDCARECQSIHLSATGHQAELMVVNDGPTLEDLLAVIAKAER